MLKGIYITSENTFKNVYCEEALEKINGLIDIEPKPYTSDYITQNPSILSDVDVILSTWGMVKLDEKILANAPRLKAVFYGAGSIRYFTTDAMWDRNITVCSAYGMNAIPVINFTLSQILFSLKDGFRHMMRLKKEKIWKSEHIDGIYKAKVGIISLGLIGSGVCEKLKQFDVDVYAYDIVQNEETSKRLNITYSSLEEIFSTCEVISLHTPWLPQTENMINGKLLSLMPQKSTFINTARGAVVNEKEMIEVLTRRPDIMALIDTPYPEPPIAESPLYTLENVLLTPHIAGAMGRDCWKMSMCMADELEKFIKNEPLDWSISREKAKILA